MATNPLEDLEMRVAYIDDSLNQLSDTLYEHTRALARLTQRCEQLESRVDALMQGGESDYVDETPPHY